MDTTQLSPEWQWLLREGYQQLAADPANGVQKSWQKAMLVEQIQLQKRGLSRIPHAGKWLWTDRSLSQASDWSTAVFKASLLPPGTSVIDGCCGAGVDLSAFGQVGNATGIEQDELLCSIAHHNANQIGSNSHCVQGDVLQLPDSSRASDDWL
ncbi:MAG: class I SAM-dependent methyltransferase, partial [Planctomycetota bacterium]